MLEFFVSRDEEHARALLHVRGGVVDLGERAHHYSLVTLARARSADMQAGYDAATQGWIELDRLARMLGIDTSHLNVQIHRARSQFAALPGLDVSQLVERRRGGVRFGDFPFRVMRGERLECQSVPGGEPRIGIIVRRRTRSSIAREHGTTIRVADRGTRVVPHAHESQRPAAPFATLTGKRHYQLGALLGEGGSGVVFRATCGETGQDVAIKLMRDDVAWTEAERARSMRFRRETSLCEALRHPHRGAADQGKRPTGGCSPYSSAFRAGPCTTGSRWRAAVCRRYRTADDGGARCACGCIAAASCTGI